MTRRLFFIIFLVTLLAAINLLSKAATAEQILFRQATVVDGTGGPSITADVLVSSDRIVEVGRVKEWPTGTRVVQAKGLALSPGFIDIHSHLDLQLPFQPLAENVVRQGVTTVVGGNCGFAWVPKAEGKSLLSGYLAALGIDDAKPRWKTMGDYHQAIEDKGTSVNLVMLAPHGMIREAVMGHREGRPSPSEMGQMKALLQGALSDGAWGMSTGLVYPPGILSDTEELIELMKVASEYDGIYATHMRDEGSNLLTSVAEAIRIGEEAGVPVEISHLKALGSPNYGMVKDALASIEAARDRGVNVTADVYPYTANSTSLSAIILPPWVFESKDMEALKTILQDESEREKIKFFAEERALSMLPDQGIYSLIPDRVLIRLIKWVLATSTLVEGVAGHPEYDGMTIKQVKRLRGHRGDVLDFCLDLIVETGRDITIISFMMSEKDVATALASPYTMIGSDGAGASEGGQHPRSYGAFPRVLGHYVREEGLLTLPQAIHKMTGMPAKKMGIKDRGVIKEGAYADLVLFDPATIIDRATYDNPKQYPDGIVMVMVNGVVTVENEAHTKATSGRVLLKAGQ